MVFDGEGRGVDADATRLAAGIMLDEMIEQDSQQPEIAGKAHGFRTAVAAGQGVSDLMVVTMKFQATIPRPV